MLTQELADREAQKRRFENKDVELILAQSEYISNLERDLVAADSVITILKQALSEKDAVIESLNDAFIN